MDVDDLTPVITSYRVCFKTEKGGPNWTGDTKKIHAIPKVDNDVIEIAIKTVLAYLTG